jgi:hypothetical protein
MSQTLPGASKHSGEAGIHHASDPLDRLTIGQPFQPPEGVRLEGFLSRLVGMSPIGRLARSKPTVWVYLDRCSTIHTFTMTRLLDLVWVDEGGRVLRVDRAVPPLRIRHCPGARGVWERHHRSRSRCRPKDCPLRSITSGQRRGCAPPQVSRSVFRPSRTTVDPRPYCGVDRRLYRGVNRRLCHVVDRRQQDPVHRQSGWGTLETLLALPILMLLFALIFQVVFLGIARLHLGYAMREGLRHASTPREPGQDTSAASADQDPGSRFASGLADGLEAWARFYGNHARSAPKLSGKSAEGWGWNGRIDAPVRVVWRLVPGKLSSARVPASAEAFAQNAAEVADHSAQQGAVARTRSPWDSHADPRSVADGPDHLYAAVSYAVPLKVPLVGAAFARALASHLACDQGSHGSQGAGGGEAGAGIARQGPFSPGISTQRTSGSPGSSALRTLGSPGLCSEGGRWHWVLGTEGRMAVPPRLLSEVGGDGAGSVGLLFPGAGRSSATQPAWGAGTASWTASPSNPPLNGSLNLAGSWGWGHAQSGSSATISSALAEGTGPRSPEVLHRQSLGGVRGSARDGVTGGNTPAGGVSDSIRALLTESSPAGGEAVHCPLQSG